MPAKTVEEIQADYTRLCAQLGQEQLKLNLLTQEIQKRVDILKVDMDAAQKAEQAKQKPEVQNVPEEVKA